MSTIAGRVARPVLSGAVAVAVVALAMPVVVGTTWGPIATALTRAHPTQILLLGVVWLAGLWAHTPALTAAMPGLSHRRALLLNLTGSCVSNLLPLGGAAGTLLNWRMARGWGFGPAAFARWALVTNLFDTLTKLLLPGVVLCWFALAADAPTTQLVVPALVGVGLLVVAAVVVGLVARDDRAVRWAGRRVDTVAARVRLVPTAPEGWAERAAAFRRDAARVVREGWPWLLGGKVLYAALQAVLLWGSLLVVGVHVEPVLVASAFAVERLLSMVVLTPAATGVVEVGMAGALAGLGVPPAAAAAGVLLYRAFVVGMEVPVGGLAILGWWLAGRRADRTRTVRVPASAAAAVAVRQPVGAGAQRSATPAPGPSRRT